MLYVGGFLFVFVFCFFVLKVRDTDLTVIQTKLRSDVKLEVKRTLTYFDQSPLTTCFSIAIGIRWSFSPFICLKMKNLCWYKVNKCTYTKLLCTKKVNDIQYHQ